MKTDDPVPSRLEAMKRDRITPPMPPNPMPHIVTRLLEIGLQEPGGMSAAPISWREINEWQAATWVHLAPWEARLIRRLSSDYVAESRRGESENQPPPWKTEPTAAEIAAAQRQLESVLG